MIELNLRGVWHPPLKNLVGTFTPGVHVILGGPEDGPSELLELCAGVRLPRRGWLGLDGEAPSASARTRRDIASLLAEDDREGDGTVRDWAAAVTRFRGFDASAALGRHAPEIAAEARTSELPLAERRKVALCFALAQPNPRLLLLHEPLALARTDQEDAIVARILEIAARAIVIVGTSSLAEARRLGGTLSILERGVLSRSPPDAWPGAITPGLRAALWVECDRPRELLAALAVEPSVASVAYDELEGAPRLRLSGQDLESLCVAVARAALAAEARIELLRSDAIGLDSVHAASAGLANAAYRAAQSSRGQGPPPLLRGRAQAQSSSEGSTP